MGNIGFLNTIKNLLIHVSCFKDIPVLFSDNIGFLFGLFQDMFWYIPNYTRKVLCK